MREMKRSEKPFDTLTLHQQTLTRKKQTMRISYPSIFLTPLALSSAVKQAEVDGARSYCEGNVRHIHLAVGHDPAREMTISFASSSSMNTTKAPIGGIHIGLAQEQLNRFVPEQEYPLKYGATIDHEHHPTEEYSSPFQHHITVDALEPSTRYYYMTVVGDREEGFEKLAATSFGDSVRNYGTTAATEKEEIVHGETDYEKGGELRSRRRLAPPAYDGSNRPCTNGHKIRSFTTAPKSSESQVSFVIIGDLGQFEHSQETLDHLRTHKQGIDAVMLVGDIAYANGNHGHWDTFFDFLDDFSIFDEVPLQVATGNHGKSDISHSVLDPS